MGKHVRGIFPFLSILLAISLFATSCTNTNSSTRDADTSAANESNSTNSGTLTIPEDFPANIPIHPGEIVVSTSAGEPTVNTWVIEVLVEDLESARLKVLSDLKQANFVLQEESGIGTGEYLATLIGSDHLIKLKVYLESETGEKEVMYIVSRT